MINFTCPLLLASACIGCYLVFFVQFIVLGVPDDVVRLGLPLHSSTRVVVSKLGIPLITGSALVTRGVCAA